jgi:tetratricopeptide (TPR) repeat protein
MTDTKWSDVAIAVRQAIGRGDFDRAHALIDAFEELAAVTGHAELAGKVAFYRGICFDHEGRWEDAVSAFRDAIDFDTEAHGEESRAVADATSSLALVYANAGKHGEAAAAYLGASDLYHAIGDATESTKFQLQACQQLANAGELEECLDELHHLGDDLRDHSGDDLAPERVYRLILESDVLRRRESADPETRALFMSTALDRAAEATRIRGPASAELRGALRRAWLSYALMCMCFRQADAAALAYSIALDLSTNNAEKQDVHDRANGWSAEGYSLTLRDLEPDAFVIAEQHGSGQYAFSTVYHQTHGVRRAAGQAGQVGDTATIQVDADGVYRLVPGPDDR